MRSNLDHTTGIPFSQSMVVPKRTSTEKNSPGKSNQSILGRVTNKPSGSSVSVHENLNQVAKGSTKSETTIAEDSDVSDGNKAKSDTNN